MSEGPMSGVPVDAGSTAADGRDRDAGDDAVPEVDVCRAAPIPAAARTHAAEAPGPDRGAWLRDPARPSRLRRYSPGAPASASSASACLRESLILPSLSIPMTLTTILSPS